MSGSRLAAVAVVLGAVGVLLQWVYGHVEVWLRHPNFLPEWSILSTSGTSFAIYTSALGILIFAFTVGIAFAAGYDLGGRIDLVADYRRVLGVVSAGSTVGVTVAWGVLFLPRYSLPSHEYVTIGDRVAYLLLVALSLGENLVRVGLLVAVGVFAGAALHHVREVDSGDESGRASSTDDSRGTDRNVADDEPDVNSRPT